MEQSDEYAIQMRYMSLESLASMSEKPAAAGCAGVALIREANPSGRTELELSGFLHQVRRRDPAQLMASSTCPSHRMPSLQVKRNPEPVPSAIVPAPPARKLRMPDPQTAVKVHPSSAHPSGCTTAAPSTSHRI